VKARHLDPELFDRVLDGLVAKRHTNAWALIIELVARTGMRSVELVGFDPKAHIDVSKGLIHIKAAKGSLDHSVPVDPEFAQVVRDSFVLPGKSTNPETVKAAMRHQWARLRVQIIGAGHGQCSLHGLRASYAVAVYRRVGKDVLLVKELLGHKYLTSTTAYLRIMQAEDKRGEILRAIGGG